MPKPSALRVRRTAIGYCLSVEGQATLREHPALLELFVVQILDRAPCSLVVDLTGCDHIDNRFLEVLADLGYHYGWGADARFAVVTRSGSDSAGLPCSESIARSPRGLTDRIGQAVELPPLEPGATDLESHLNDWHARLAQLGGPFQPLLERLCEPLVEALA